MTIENNPRLLSPDIGTDLPDDLNLSPCPPDLIQKALRGTLSSGRGAVPQPPRPEETLVQAIVTQAVDDWRGAVRILRAKPGRPEAAARRRETEQFFLSDWFQSLTGLDGRAFLRRLEVSEHVPSSGPGHPLALRLRVTTCRYKQVHALLRRKARTPQAER